MSKREQYSDYVDYLKKRCANVNYNEGIEKKTTDAATAVTKFKEALVLNANDVEALYELKLLKANNGDC